MSFNVLISSVSKKVPLIHAVRQAMTSLKIEGKLIGADCNLGCIGKYFVDQFWQIPRQDELTFDVVLRYSLQHQIKAIIPTRDGELPFYAQYREAFKEQGISCLISSIDSIELCRDKHQFAQALSKQGYPVIPTFISLDEQAQEQYVVKERFGAGSRTMRLNLNAKQACEFAKTLKSPIYQPYIQGIEYSIDLYMDRSGKTQGVIARTRDQIIDGESQITTSVVNQDLQTLCANMAESLGLYGHVIFQVFCDNHHQFHVIECNPRFGGASTLSIAMGLDSFYWFFLETLNRPLPQFVRAPHEKRQVRYAEDLILNI